MGRPQLLLQRYWEEEEGEELLGPGSMDPARLCGARGQQRDAQSNSVVVLRGTWLFITCLRAVNAAAYGRLQMSNNTPRENHPNCPQNGAASSLLPSSSHLPFIFPHAWKVLITQLALMARRKCPAAIPVRSELCPVQLCGVHGPWVAS